MRPTYSVACMKAAVQQILKTLELSSELCLPSPVTAVRELASDPFRILACPSFGQKRVMIKWKIRLRAT